MLAYLALLLFSAPDAVLPGNWVTPDKSIVQVYSCETSNLCVRIATIGQPDVPRVDARNPDTAKRTRPLCGLTIGTGFMPDGKGAAKGGKIYDPKSGNTYSAQMKGDGDTVKLHGYIGVSLLGRTETWQRAAGTVPACK